MIRCPLCTKTFRNQAGLDLHVVTHTKEKPHKCIKCTAAFGRESSLKQHVRSVHDGIKEIKKKNSHCPLCSYKCYSKSYLKVHLGKHSAEQPFSCEVPDCGFKTKYEPSLRQHAHVVHSDERPYECPSEGCGYKAKQLQTLKNHLTVHSSEKPFTCQMRGCNYSCKIKHYLKNHTSKAHSDEVLFKCSTCDFGAKTKSSFREHQLTHIKIKRFECQAPKCSYTCHYRNKLKRHFDAKHRKKDVLCTEPECNYRCGSITLLKRHLHTQRIAVEKCPNDSCNFSTKHKYSLLTHISLRHKDLQPASRVKLGKFDVQVAGRPEVAHALHCRFPNCGYHTRFPHHFDRRRIAHKKEIKRQHVCSFCFFTFRYLHQLKAHVQSHVQEKPYSCSHCNYTASGGVHLRRHARRTHHIHVIARGEDNRYERKCSTCGRSYTSYSEFVFHSMSHLQSVVVLERLDVQVV